MLERLPYHPPDCAVGQRLKRRPAAQKDLTTVTPRAPALHVGHDGLADILWEGEAACPAGFAGAQVEPTIGPIDVVEAECHHVLSAQAKPREEEEHGAVAQTAGGPVVVYGQYALDFLGRQA